MAGREKKKVSGKSAGKAIGRKSSGSKQKLEDFQPFRDEIIFVLTLMVCVLMALSGFGLCGPVGKGINWIVFGAFGLIGWILPYVLFLGICFYISNRGNRIAVMKCICSIILYFLVATLVQNISSWGVEKIDVFQCASVGASQKQGGGLTGGFLAWGMTSALGKMGTMVVLIAVILILTILITEHLIFAHLREKGRDMQKNRQIRREQMRKLQEEQEDMEYEQEEPVYSNGWSPKGKGFFSLSGLSIFKGKPPVIGNENEPSQQKEQMEENRRAASVAGTTYATMSATGKAIAEPFQMDKIPEAVDNTMCDFMHGKSESRVAGDGPDFIEQPDFIVAKEYRDDVAEELVIDHEPDYEVSSEMEKSYITAYEVNHEPESKEEVYKENYEPEVAVEAYKEDYEPEAEEAYNGDYEPETVEEVNKENYKSASDTEKDGYEDSYETEYEVEDATDYMAEYNAAYKNSKSGTEKVLEVKQESRTDVKTEVKPVSQPAKKPYQFPRLDLLSQVKSTGAGMSEQELKATAMKLQSTLESFGVKVMMKDYCCGPSVTRYELQPAMGVKVSRITSLADDIKLSLAAADIRIEAPIPGKAAVGIEVPNKVNSTVTLRSLLESNAFKNATSNVTFAVGKDIAGKVIVTDIAKMPHLLIAGATGSGKSVCINTLIMSILYKAHPDDVKLIMIDPKVVELSCYNGIPHLMIPVVTDPKKAAGALNWAVSEMIARYEKFAEVKARNIVEYHDRIKTVDSDKNDTPYQKIPQIVIIVDELADLMMVASNEVDSAICRLAQLARAAGIHLVIATQRPSVNVITGTIKANIPSRIAFAVSSAIDSRTILDSGGAEKLLGKGDMLFFPSGYPKPLRVQGAFVSDKEVSNVVEYLTKQYGEVQYDNEVEEKIKAVQVTGNTASSTPGNELDDYFIEAGKFIIEKDKASIGILQRAFKVGFNRAARIMEQLHEAGVVGEEEGTKPRKVLMSMEEFEAYIDEYV